VRLDLVEKPDSPVEAHQPAWRAAEEHRGASGKGEDHQVRDQATFGWTRSMGCRRTATAGRQERWCRRGCPGCARRGDDGHGWHQNWCQKSCRWMESWPGARMRRAGCWRRLAWCSGEEGSRSSRGWRHVQFSKTEVGANVGEGGEGPLASDDVSHEQEPLVEAP
jgi:hypothetical protein